MSPAGINPEHEGAIVRALDARATGQAEAKRALARAVNLQARGIARAPVLLVGASGTGKTLLARSLAEALGLPFAAVDATHLVPPGYKGTSLDERLAEVFAGLRLREDGLQGLVFVDEVDKLAGTGDAVFREHSATSLLGLLNGDPVAYTGGPFAPAQTLPTKTLLVVAAGAFQHVRESVASERAGAVGFRNGADDGGGAASGPTGLVPVTIDDVRRHSGLLPELVNRFRLVAELESPTLADLERAARSEEVLRRTVRALRPGGVRVMFGASFFRAWAARAAREPEAGYRALATDACALAGTLLRLGMGRGRGRPGRRLLVVGDDFSRLAEETADAAWFEQACARGASLGP